MYLPSDEHCPEIVRALWDRDFAEAKVLIAGGASLDDTVDVDGDSPLHRAAEEADLEMIRFYHAHRGLKAFESFDEIEHTPLIRAAARGQLESVRTLLACGANINARCVERAGNTAIREAVREGHATVVKELLSCGADPTITGWMGISAVDQAFYTIKGGFSGAVAKEIQAVLSAFRKP